MTPRTQFDHGSATYDLMVSLNPGYHRELRRAASALAQRVGNAPLSLLDLGCGSGASTTALLEQAPGGSRIMGVDASAGMLEQARGKPWLAGATFRRGVAGRMDTSRLGRFDGILACYLFRNVSEQDRDTAIAEAFEMLQPGGWLVVQEYSIRGNRHAAAVWDAVCRAVIIPLGTVVAKDPELYRYLRRSVHEFDSVPEFADRLAAAGFEEITHRTATGWQRGILHTIAARRPEEDK